MPRTRTALAPIEAVANDQAIETFTALLGGRAALADALAIGTDAPEADTIVRLLHDPAYAHLSVRQLCTLANLTVVDLFTAFKSAMFARAHLVAAAQITEKLIPVVNDVMDRAAPHEVPCYACGASGRMVDLESKELPPALITCTQCCGHGKVLQLPDLDRQKLALELGRLVTKAPLLQQNTLNVDGGGAAGAASSSLIVEQQQVVRELLKGPRTPIVPTPAEPSTVVEAEVVDSSSA